MIRFLGFLFALSILIALPQAGQAQVTITNSGITSGPIVFTPEVPIATFNGKITVSAETFGQYVKAVFIYFIWSVGILAVVMVTFGGIKWVSAAGNPTRIHDARDIINNAIIGLIIALTSIVLLQTINPALTNFPGLVLATVSGKVLNIEQEILKQVGEFPSCSATQVLSYPRQACSQSGTKIVCVDGLNTWINNAAAKYHVDALLVKAEILHESSKNNQPPFSGPYAGTGSSAYGLGQFLGGTLPAELSAVNNGLPSECPVTAFHKAVPPDKTCAEWLDKHLEIQVQMVAHYLKTISNYKCVHGDLTLTAAGYFLGPNAIERDVTSRQPDFCSGDTIAQIDTAQVVPQAVPYVQDVRAKYIEECRISSAGAATPPPGVPTGSYPTGPQN